MICTGNIQVSRNHLSLGRDIIIPEAITPDTITPFKYLADSIHGLSEDVVRQGKSQSLAIMQLSHGGRQSPSFFGGRPLGTPALAPSSIRVGSGSSNIGFLSRILHQVLFPTPKEMTIADINDVVDMFVRGAEVAVESGFDGIQLHAAHGC
jgi:2,4-dienoyl-CoA reductase-like NADH-dependent reductase (Old Yellow Enzyme family)